MQHLIAPKDMQACERHYFENMQVPSLSIMENAAQALLHLTLKRFPNAKYICIACGSGGNGGDGYACARLLKERDKQVILFAAVPARHPDAQANARRAGEAGIEILPASRLSGMPRPDLWIDCLYGTGLSRAPEGDAADLIRRMHVDHAQGSGVIACDIPSGLDGETGRAFSPCVAADITLSFHCAKYGHFLQDGLDVCGKVLTADVGFPPSILPEKLPQLFEPADLKTFLPPRRRNIHKGSCGHLLIIAGSTGMAGAAALCARAALRSGVGLVTIACPQELLPILQMHAPCAMCIPLPQENGVLSLNALSLIQDALSGKSAVVIGPGLKRCVPPEIIAAVLKSGLPAVIDADALNIISENPALKALLAPHHILTPHIGEAARLLQRPCAAPIADAQSLSDLGCTAVLKGASRVIAGRDHILLSASGGCGMARGGSGDILSGVMGALLAEDAQRPAEFTAACACEIHGLAGALAQRQLGDRAMNAADIIDFLPEVFKTHVHG